jgi:poly(3-hydroxyalkanoate) depolymerase
MNKPRASNEPDLQTRIVDVAGRRLRVAVREGDGRRPPLLLCNGLGVRLEGLQPFVDALRPETGVIRFDVPGVGESPTPVLPYRMWGMARLTSQLLNALDIPRVDVLGVSWGGALAQQFALQRPHRCRRLILVSTALGVLGGIPGRPRVIPEMLTRRRFDDPEHARQVAPKIYGGKARSEAQSIPIFAHMRINRRGLFYQQLAALGWTSLPFAPLIRQPTLILTGDDDPIIPPVNGRMLRQALLNSELRIFHDGHLGLVTSADELAPIVEDFLDRT